MANRDGDKSGHHGKYIMRAKLDEVRDNLKPNVKQPSSHLLPLGWKLIEVERR
jgi:hypothetical protein